jgi:hypothetical protein
MIEHLRRRVELLERRVGGAVILTMADGTTRQLPGASKYYHRLCALLDSDAECAELTWVKTAAHIDEPGHVYELLRALLQGPNETEASECVPMR